MRQHNSALASVIAITLALMFTLTASAGEKSGGPTWGDIVVSGENDVADVQCVILVASWELVASMDPFGIVPPPVCTPFPGLADLNCTDGVNVVDVQIATLLALGAPLGIEIDANTDGIPDACFPPCSDASECDDGNSCTADYCVVSEFAPYQETAGPSCVNHQEDPFCECTDSCFAAITAGGVSFDPDLPPGFEITTSDGETLWTCNCSMMEPSGLPETVIHCGEIEWFDQTVTLVPGDSIEGLVDVGGIPTFMPLVQCPEEECLGCDCDIEVCYAAEPPLIGSVCLLHSVKHGSAITDTTGAELELECFDGEITGGLLLPTFVFPPIEYCGAFLAEVSNLPPGETAEFNLEPGDWLADGDFSTLLTCPTLECPTDCDDGNACNGLETCVDGSCQPGVTFTICFDDGDPCTNDYCDPETGGCVYEEIEDCIPTCETDTFKVCTCFDGAYTCGGLQVYDDESGLCQETSSTELCGWGCNGFIGANGICDPGGQTNMVTIGCPDSVPCNFEVIWTVDGVQHSFPWHTEFKIPRDLLLNSNALAVNGESFVVQNCAGAIVDTISAEGTNWVLHPTFGHDPALENACPIIETATLTVEFDNDLTGFKYDAFCVGGETCPMGRIKLGAEGDDVCISTLQIEIQDSGSSEANIENSFASIGLYSSPTFEPWSLVAAKAVPGSGVITFENFDIEVTAPKDGFTELFVGPTANTIGGGPSSTAVPGTTIHLSTVENGVEAEGLATGAELMFEDITTLPGVTKEITVVGLRPILEVDETAGNLVGGNQVLGRFWLTAENNGGNDDFEDDLLEMLIFNLPKVTLSSDAAAFDDLELCRVDLAECLPLEVILGSSAYELVSPGENRISLEGGSLPFNEVSSGETVEFVFKGTVSGTVDAFLQIGLLDVDGFFNGPPGLLWGYELDEDDLVVHNALLAPEPHPAEYPNFYCGVLY